MFLLALCPVSTLCSEAAQGARSEAAQLGASESANH